MLERAATQEAIGLNRSRLRSTRPVSSREHEAEEPLAASGRQDHRYGGTITGQIGDRAPACQICGLLDAISHSGDGLEGQPGCASGTAKVERTDAQTIRRACCRGGEIIRTGRSALISHI